MKRKRISLSLLIIMIVFAGLFVVNNDGTVYLEPFEMIISEEAVTLSVREEVIKNLVENGVKGDIEAAMIIHKLKSNTILEEEGITLYRVKVSYAWADQIAVYLNNQFKFLIPNMTTDQLFISDADGNGSYELISQGSLGSGLHYIQLTHYDFKSHILITNNFYNDNKGIELQLVDNKIMAYSYDFNQQKLSSKPIGAVLFEDALEIENLDMTIFEKNTED